jgi:hypothetical protein
MEFDPLITKNYKAEEQGFWINDDDYDLVPVFVPLPKFENRQDAKDITEVDGYGLKTEEQYFRYQITPKKVLQLNKSGMTLEAIWKELEKNYFYYYEEIEWIKLQIYRRFNGYWFYNNGVLTFIDGWHYFYLNFWNVHQGLPEYRDRDRRWFIACRFFYADPYCLGVLYNKHRQEGATTRVQCVLFLEVTCHIGMSGGTQSKNETDAKKVFQIFLTAPFKKLLFFWKPNHNLIPNEKLHFEPKSERVSNTKKDTYADMSLGGMIDFRSSTESAYDGVTNYIIFHNDEFAKIPDVDIFERSKVINKVLLRGNHKLGFVFNTSTVEYSIKQGREQALKLAKLSKDDVRDKNGFTNSKYRILFFPAHDCLEGFIDRHGMSVEDYPTDSQAKYLATQWHKFYPKEVPYKRIGSKEFIENTLSSLLEAKDMDGYSSEKVKMPEKFVDCFHVQTKDSWLNVVKIQLRLEQLRMNNPFVRRGNLSWLGTPHHRDSKVIWQDDPNGRWISSLTLQPEETNKRWWDRSFGLNGSFRPYTNNRFVVGGDPFNFDNVKYGKGSKGAITTIEVHNIKIDPYSKPFNEWKTNKIRMTYAFRHNDTDLFVEDTIMTCVYSNSMLNSEDNSPILVKGFKRLGYEGYCMNLYDEIKNEVSETTGFHANTGTKNTGASFLMNYVEQMADTEVHSEVLEQLLEYREPIDLKHLDLVASLQAALIGANSLVSVERNQKRTVLKASDLYRSEKLRVA